MPYNEKIRKTLNALTAERKDILYRSAVVRRRTGSLYPKAPDKLMWLPVPAGYYT